MTTERAAFLLPDNGETERGVKTIEGERSLLTLSRVVTDEKMRSGLTEAGAERVIG